MQDIFISISLTCDLIIFEIYDVLRDLYHLFKLKKAENIHGEVLSLVKLQ